MDAQTRAESEFMEPAYGGSEESAVIMEPQMEGDQENLRAFDIRESVFGGNGVPTAMMQEDVIDVQATMSGCDHDYSKPADYIPVDSSEQEQDDHPTVFQGQFASTSGALQPTTGDDETRPHLGTAYGPAYHLPYLAPVPQDYASPATTWTPFQLDSFPPQAYQQGGVEATEAGGPCPSSGAGVSQSIDVSGGCLGAVASAYGMGAAAGPSGPAKILAGGVPIDCPQDRRDIHNAKERVRRARLRDSWAQLRQIVPGLNENSDNATVCERVAEFTREMNQALSAMYDPETRNAIIQEFIDTFHPQ